MSPITHMKLRTTKDTIFVVLKLLLCLAKSMKNMRLCLYTLRYSHMKIDINKIFKKHKQHFSKNFSLVVKCRAGKFLGSV